MGLIYITFPLKLKDNFNFSEIGLFSFSSYPYSLKLLWSPFVDTYYFKNIGLRKTWIIFSQLVCGCLLIILSYNYDYLMNEKKIYILTLLAFLIIFCVATQDIAVDAIGLTISESDVI